MKKNWSKMGTPSKKANRCPKNVMIMTAASAQHNQAFDAAITRADGTIATNAVTANGDYGILTSASISTAADAWEAAITFTNSKIVAGSVIVLTTNTVIGTIGTNGVPHAVVTAKTTGSCTLRIGNIGANALSAGTPTFAYRVYNTPA